MQNASATTVKKSHISKMKVEELRNELTSLHVTPTGKKTDMVASLWSIVSRRWKAQTPKSSPKPSSAKPKQSPPSLPKDVLGNIQSVIKGQPLNVRMKMALGLGDRAGIEAIRQLSRPSSLLVIGRGKTMIPASDAGSAMIHEMIAEEWVKPDPNGSGVHIELSNDNINVQAHKSDASIIPLNFHNTIFTIRFAKVGTRVVIDKVALKHMPSPPWWGDYVGETRVEYLTDALIGVQWLREWVFHGAQIKVSSLLIKETDKRLVVSNRDQLAFIAKAVKILKAK